MRRNLLAAAAMILCLAPAVHGDAKEETKKLLGDWVPTEMEIGGKKLPAEVLKNMVLTLGDGTYTVKAGKEDDKGTWKLDADAKPRRLKIEGTDGPNKGKTLLAIFEIADGKLRVCYDHEGKEYPKEFKTKEDSKLILATYEKKK